MRVVLMGRTMAGKSTLLAALTGGSAERIGVGAQRTSRDVFAAPALDLQDVEIVDTPGVGAKDGAEDVALAMAEVPGADLVLWVASNDSFQEETAQALRAVAFRGKPVVVALNCRASLVTNSIVRTSWMTPRPCSISTKGISTRSALTSRPQESSP